MEGKGGEVRRIHIIYFLSHLGHDEHPHLIRVHHFNRSGVYLRDVKRWLADLRGKDMPEAFAWSYKRRYKTGYVWQDLLDHDLITPLADNEYVLKGSQLVHASFDYRSHCESKIPESKQQKICMILDAFCNAPAFPCRQHFHPPSDGRISLFMIVHSTRAFG